MSGHLAALPRVTEECRADLGDQRTEDGIIAGGGAER